jgi:hypothetical protein
MAAPLRLLVMALTKEKESIDMGRLEGRIAIVTSAASGLAWIGALWSTASRTPETFLAQS